MAHNTSSSADTFDVNWNSTQYFTYTLPAGGIATFQWSGTPVALSNGYSINAGGSATGSFSADGYYSGGQTYSTTASISTSGVTNPAPQEAYQTERYGNFTYRLPNLLPWCSTPCSCTSPRSIALPRRKRRGCSGYVCGTPCGTPCGSPLR